MKNITLMITLDEAQTIRYRLMVERILSNDIFVIDCIGYWASVLAEKIVDGKKIRLLKEETPIGEAEDATEIAAFMDCQPLPQGFYWLNENVATRIVERGIRLFGENFVTYVPTNGGWESEDIDTAIQTELLGEQRY